MPRTLILCRHAESEWNVQRRYQGRLECDLSPLGIRQAEALRDHLATRPLAAVYTSPLRRALRTAEIVASHSECAVMVRPELTDVDHGEWSGLAHAEVEARWPELARLWREHPAAVRFPGGESLAEVRARALSFLAWVRHEHAEGQALVVTHGEVLQLLLGHLLEMPPDLLHRLPCDHCQVSIVEDYDIPLTLAINDGCHLQGLRSSADPLVR